MKTIIISILLFFTVNAQNVWYVDANSPSKGNDALCTGRNWQHAWAWMDSSNWAGTLDGINWAIVQAGDTIYLSGGTDTTFYTPPNIYGSQALMAFNEANYTFANGDPVIVTGAWHPGHNGRVVFATSANDQQRVFWFKNISNVKFTGLTFWNRQNPDSAGGGVGNIGGAESGIEPDSMIFLENCHLISEGAGGFLGVKSTNCTVRNCLIEDRIDIDYDNDNDAIGINSARAGHTLDHNIIILRNGSMTTTSHRDFIQFGEYGMKDAQGDLERRVTTISNNLIIDTRKEGVSWNAVIYAPATWANQTYYIYNNIIVTRLEYDNVSPFFIYRYNIPEFWPWWQSVHILNNTVICKGKGTSSVFTHTWLDTIEIKNNLVVIDSTYDVFFNMDAADAFPYSHKEIDYNYYAARGGMTSSFGLDNGVIKNFTNWRAHFGYDLHSNTTDSRNVTFTNKYGLEREDYYTESGRDAGVNLWDEYPFLRTDALGNPRPQSGSWDIGALEYQVGGGSNNIMVKGKVFLQGPFSSNSMLTNLNQNSMLPNTQPYNTAPWNYNGNESFNPSSNTSVVDWVLVELRNAANPVQVVSRRAALLKSNGLLLETNGTEGVLFDNVEPGNYYIVIKHRNHLAIMSASPIPLTMNSTLYDFTTAMNKAYGQNPMIELAPGIFGMYAADGNADGVIDITDRDEVWLVQNGTMGYLKGDFDMNSGVTIHDVNQIWNITNGRMTQVP